MNTEIHATQPDETREQERPNLDVRLDQKARLQASEHRAQGQVDGRGKHGMPTRKAGGEDRGEVRDDLGTRSRKEVLQQDGQARGPQHGS